MSIQAGTEYFKDFKVWEVLLSGHTIQWLNPFIKENHSTPPELIRTSDSWNRPNIHVYAVTDKETDELIGINCLRQVTKHLVIMEKTIVSKKHRGKGYGRDLIKLAEAKTKGLGAGKLAFHVFTFNKPMIKLVKSMDYKREGTLKNHEAPGIHEHVFGKLL